MALHIRPAVAADAEACGRIIHDAFAGIAAAHAFPPDFPSAEAGAQLAAAMIASPAAYGVVAESDDGRVVGSNFLAEGDPIRAVGPITVDPAFQGGGVGRRLMEAVLERARGARGVRLVQDAFNTRSVALYASLGFEVKEPLLLMSGTPRSGPVPGLAVRPMAEGDLGACAALHAEVHGVDRANEVREALRLFAPMVVERGGRVRGYLTGAGLLADEPWRRRTRGRHGGAAGRGGGAAPGPFRCCCRRGRRACSGGAWAPGCGW